VSSPIVTSPSPGIHCLPEDLERYLCPAARRIADLSCSIWGPRRRVLLVGRSRALEETLEKAMRIAPFDEPVLLTGESGVGKELLASALYVLGPRSGKPFVPVNCPQFQEGNLTVSELFGHVKGSFTGAVADRKGCFELADGGVIFLDEIGDLHMSAQLMLLRALSTGEFTPLGATRSRTVNVRVIAATNRPISQTGLGDHFRDDLFFRLRYFHLRIPPLREREDDWLLLAEFALESLKDQHGVAKRLSPRALQILGQYSWPGNVRELCAVVTTGYALSSGAVIEPEDFEELLQDETFRFRRVEDSAIRRIVVEGESFWSVVHRKFMDRELSRAQVRTIIAWGLRKSEGSYRKLLELFGLPPEDYQRFMDFLRHHRLKPRGQGTEAPEPRSDGAAGQRP